MQLYQKTFLPFCPLECLRAKRYVFYDYFANISNCFRVARYIFYFYVIIYMKKLVTETWKNSLLKARGIYMEDLHNQNELKRKLQINSTVLRQWKTKDMPTININGKEHFDLQQVLVWRKEVTAPIEQLEIGKIYKNSEISEAFKCSQQGGMRRSHLTNTLVLFSDHTKGIYEDKPDIDENGNEILLYTGMGQNGDQDLSFGQNKTLSESNENSIRVFVFEAFRPGEHIFRGEVKLVDDPYMTEQFDRKVWIFPLGFLDQGFVVTEELSDEKDKLQEKEASKLTDEELYERAKKVERVGKRAAVTQVYVRNTHVTAHVKRRAEGHCDLCGKPAPFFDRNGKPFLECHHVEWLSRGGEDSIDNAVALDPSCHRKMHELILKTDVNHLKRQIEKYSKKYGNIYYTKE